MRIDACRHSAARPTLAFPKEQIGSGRTDVVGRPMNLLAHVNEYILRAAQMLRARRPPLKRVCAFTSVYFVLMCMFRRPVNLLYTVEKYRIVTTDH